MLISSFESVKDLNHWYQSFFTSENNLIPFNEAIHNIVTYNLYPIARSYVSSSQMYASGQDPSTPYLRQQVIDYIEEANSSSSSSKIIYEQYTPELSNKYKNLYYFPFTKSSLISTFFSDCIPSFADNFISFLKNNNLLIQYGPGLGNAYAFKRVDLNLYNVDIENINSNFDYRVYKNSFEEFFSFYEGREKDFFFLKSENEFLRNKISYLETLVDSLQDSLENQSFITWA
jgi:hypothetical protein